MSVNSTPMRVHRLVALFLSFAWGVIAMAVGIHGQVQSDNDTKALQKLVPPGFTLSIKTDDVHSSGTVITVVSGIIALLSLIYFILTLFVSNLATRTLPIQWMTLAFLGIWLFATQIAFTVFFANREAQVTITAGGVAIPDNQVEGIESLFGVTPVYRHIDYLRLIAILPWFTILFTAIASAITMIASRRRSTVTSTKA